MSVVERVSTPVGCLVEERRIEIMRFLLKIRFPEDKANAMAKDGSGVNPIFRTVPIVNFRPSQGM